MHHLATPDHAQHDTSLIAGHAAGDLTATRTTAAAALLASCRDCTDLHRDLLAISAAMAALPHEARAPRDYRLSADQAASLRRGSWLRGLLRPFGTLQAARQMAAAFTSLGVAGLLVAAFIPGLLGGAAAGPSQERDGITAAGASAPSAAPAAPDLARPTSDALYGGPGTSPATVKQDVEDSGLEIAGGDRGATGTDGDNGGPSTVDALSGSALPNPLVVASLGFLLVGLAIFGLRLAARRVR